MRSISLPAEHGGYLTAAGATLAASLIAPQPMRAVAAGGALLIAFLARGAVDRWAVGKPLARRDPWLLAGLGVLAAAACAVLPPWLALASVLAALGLLAGSAVIRRLRRHRDALVETGVMAVLGASAGWAAWAAGADASLARPLGLVLAVHAASAVPLVRTRLRKLERVQARGAALVVLVAITAATLLLVETPAFALALVPRGLHAVVHFLSRSDAHPRASTTGIVETALLAVVVAVLTFLA